MFENVSISHDLFRINILKLLEFWVDRLHGEYLNINKLESVYVLEYLTLLGYFDIQKNFDKISNKRFLFIEYVHK